MNIKSSCKKMVARKGELSFYDIFTLGPRRSQPVIKKVRTLPGTHCFP